MLQIRGGFVVLQASAILSGLLSTPALAGETPCKSSALCDGDVNGDAVVDLLDAGYILARFARDICEEGNCQADVNCDGAIDPLDVGYVLSRFGMCDSVPSCDMLCPPKNDNCEDAFVLEDGLTPFSTIGATTDGPPLPVSPRCPMQCDPFDCDVDNDIWFSYTTSCTGTVTVSTCDDGDPATGEGDYDTMLAAYQRCDCPVDNERNAGCNDDAIGCAGFTSLMTFPVIEETCYLIRVGGFSGATGTGSLSVSCE